MIVALRAESRAEIDAHRAARCRTCRARRTASRSTTSVCAGARTARREGRVDARRPRPARLRDRRRARRRRAPDEVVIERGVADAWHVGVGDAIQRRAARARCAWSGIAVSPDNVAFPLASRAARVRRRARGSSARPGGALPVEPGADLGQRPRARRRACCSRRARRALGIARLRFVTRAGVRVLIDQAAGIVIALLVAFSLVALGAAGDDARRRRARRRPAAAAGHRRAARDRLLARADRRPARRSSGAGRRCPPARSASPSGALAVRRRRPDRLLAALNEQPPGVRAAGAAGGRAARRSSRSSRPPRRGPRGARRPAPAGRAAARRRARGPRRAARAWAAASPRSGRGWRWRAAGARRRPWRCSR